MGVYIKGMTMPTSCAYCELYENDWHWCRAAKKEYYDTIENKARPDWCPLVHVSPHGRLIDADALKNSLIVDYSSVIYSINNAPTIIPTEEGE